jgi:hypothetical protein
MSKPIGWTELARAALRNFLDLLDGRKSAAVILMPIPVSGATRKRAPAMRTASPATIIHFQPAFLSSSKTTRALISSDTGARRRLESRPD